MQPLDKGRGKGPNKNYNGLQYKVLNSWNGNLCAFPRELASQ